MSTTSPSAAASRPRSVALVGPSGSGKSTLFDALLAAAGAANRRAAGARNRSMTTELRLAHCEFLGDPWSLLDCPGSVEFSHEAAGALAVADLAVVVCEPVPERVPAVAPLLRLLRELGVPKLIFINKIETMDGSLRDILAALQAISAQPLVLRQVPIREADHITGYVDVVSERAYRYRKGQASELVSLPSHMREPEREALAGLVEVLADHDDAILEKVLEDVVPSSEEIYRQLHKDQATGAITEVLLGAAEQDAGVRRLWKALRHDAPDPLETAAARGIASEGEPLLQVFKTVHAAHTGKISYARVWRGAVRDGVALNGSRLSGLYRQPAGEPAKIPEAQAGDLVLLGRLEGVGTGDTLTPSGSGASLAFPEASAPVYAMAIATADRKDDVKLSAALRKLAEEDPGLLVEHDQDTGETVLRGQGEMHLNATVERLAHAHNVKIVAHPPRVAFKETIRRAVRQHARLKRQTGGHGQFADVTLEIEPRARGEGFVFIDKIVGGAVPRQYIPAVGQAAEEALRRGPFGYPVVDVAVRLVDGGFHSVDSSDMAFRTATRTGMSEGLAKADPILLEPIDRVTVHVPNDFTASAQRLLTGRRGHILGYAERESWPGWDEIEAEVPAAEMHEFIIELRSQTMGLGTFRQRFDHLAEATGRLLERVTQEATAEGARR